MGDCWSHFVSDSSRQMLSLARSDEEHVEGNVEIAFTLDEVMDSYEFVEVFVNREIGHLPGDGLEIIDDGAGIVKARDEEMLFLLDDVPADLAHLTHGIVQVPGWLVLRAFIEVDVLLTA